MKYKLFRLPLILAGLIGGVVLLASSGAYAVNEAYLSNSPPSLAVDGDEASRAFEYTVLTDHEDEFDGEKPGTGVDNYEPVEYENVAFEDQSIDDFQDTGSATGSGVGMGVAPLFDTYGVIRASSSQDKSTYVALGFMTDELIMDEDDTLDREEKNALSYGFGVNSSSSNFEYMMSLDEDNSGVSAVGMRFTSEF